MGFLYPGLGAGAPTSKRQSLAGWLSIGCVPRANTDLPVADSVSPKNHRGPGPGRAAVSDTAVLRRHSTGRSLPRRVQPQKIWGGSWSGCRRARAGWNQRAGRLRWHRSADLGGAGLRLHARSTDLLSPVRGSDLPPRSMNGPSSPRDRCEHAVGHRALADHDHRQRDGGRPGLCFIAVDPCLRRMAAASIAAQRANPASKRSNRSASGPWSRAACLAKLFSKNGQLPFCG